MVDGGAMRLSTTGSTRGYRPEWLEVHSNAPLSSGLRLSRFIVHFVHFNNSAGRGSKMIGSAVGESCLKAIVSVDHSASSLYRKDRFSRLCRAHRIRKIKQPK